MSPEHQTVPIQTLVDHHERLTQIYDQRRALISRLKGDPDNLTTPPLTLEAKLLEGVRIRVEKSAQRIGQRAQETIEEIDSRLPELASSYEEELTRKQRAFSRVMAQAARKQTQVSPAELTAFTNELQEVQTRPDRYPLLAKALGRLPEPETPKSPTIPPAESPKQRLTILDDTIHNLNDGDEKNIQTLPLNKAEIAVLTALAHHVGQPVITGDLSREVFGNNPPAQPLRQIMAGLKHQLNLPGKPQVIVSKAAAQRSWYMLSPDVEVIFQEPLEKPEPIPQPPKEVAAKKEIPPPLFESRIQALAQICDNPQAPIEEITNFFEVTRLGKKFSKPQVLWSLKKACNFLYARVKKGLANEAEKTLFNKIKKVTGKENNEQATGAMILRLNGWYIQQQSVNTEEAISALESREVKIEPLSEKEAAALALLVKTHQGARIGLNGSSFTFEVEPAILLICDQLIEQHLMVDPRHLQKDEILALRHQAINKTEKILQSENINEVLQAYSGDIETLLMWLYFEDTDQMHGLITQFLQEKPELSWQVAQGQLRKTWREWTSKQLTDDKRDNPNHVREIEKRNPQARININQALDEIDDAVTQNILVLPANRDAVTRVFKGIKRTAIIQAITAGIVKPEPQRGMDLFDITQVAALVYLHISQISNRGGLDSGAIKSLNDLIKEELARRAK